MVGVERIDGGPRSAIVVGAGIVGLSTAWFLQERGVEVTVVDRTGVAAGASWGNAGWIAPVMTFALNSRAVRGNVILNEECIEAFDVLIANGVDASVTDAPITAVFRSTNEAQRMLRKLRELKNAGQAMYLTALSGAALREQVPLASSAIISGLNINAQHFVDPRRFVEALGHSVSNRGNLLAGLEIRDVLSTESGVAVYPNRGKLLTADVAVIATGARLSQLADRWLRTPVQAGHGYSFVVPVDRPAPSPIYLPDVRVACTPCSDAIRVSGTTEFRRSHGRPVPERVEAIIASASPLLDGVRWAERSDVWVGAHPVASDGRPLIGEVAQGVYVAGGHGMWGLTHGPVTGRLLAEHITTGKQSQALAEFDPLRRSRRWHSLYARA